MPPEVNTKLQSAGKSTLNFLRQWKTIYSLTRILLLERHGASFLGAYWVLIQPLVFALFYAFIFTVIYPVKFQLESNMSTNYLLYLLSGLIPWLTFQAVLVSSPASFTSNANLIKNFSFPVASFPIREVAVALATWLVGTVVTLIVAFSFNLEGARMWPLLGFLLVIQVVAMIGWALFFATVGVFIKDLGNVVAISAMPLLFLMPIVYTVDSAPVFFRLVILFNPFSYMVMAYQDIYIYGYFAHPAAWFIFSLFAGFSLFMGLRTFRKSQSLLVGAL